MFFRDDSSGVHISYNDLVHGLEQGFSDDFFSKLIYLLIHNLDIELTRKYFDQVTFQKTLKFLDKEELITQVKNTQSSIIVETSGTMGSPKKIKHKIQNLFQNVKISENLSQAIWGYTYNPYHIAGLQVFFQAFLNGNTIIYLYGKNIDDIAEQIQKYFVTHLSGTSTFYKLLISTNKKFDCVKRITFGGEISTENLHQKMIEIFPRAKITNIYATSESGTLFVSHNHIFTINDSNKAKIVENELYIHKKFIGENEYVTSDWYATGDIVKIIDQNPIRFVFQYRNSDIINVGGHKVDPCEVEYHLESHPDISHASVYKKSNSVLGDIILCDVVKNDRNLTEKDILTFLQNKKLERYKIPRMIKFKKQPKFSENFKSKRVS